MQNRTVKKGETAYLKKETGAFCVRHEGRLIAAHLVKPTAIALAFHLWPKPEVPLLIVEVPNG